MPFFELGEFDEGANRCNTSPSWLLRNPMTTTVRSVNVKAHPEFRVTICIWVHHGNCIWFWPLFLTKTRLHPTAFDILEHSFLQTKIEMSSASPKPVPSEDILGQKVSFSLSNINLYSDNTL